MAIGNEPSLLGQIGQSFSGMKVGLNVDAGPVKTLTSAFKGLSDQITQLNKKIEEASTNAAGLMQNLSGVAGSGPATTMGSGTKVLGRGGNSSPPIPSTTGGGGGGRISQMIAAMNGGGELTGKQMAVAQGVSVAGAAVQAATATIDARIERGKDYALSADRMSVLYQQMTGLSQQQVQDKYRYPLLNYRLGAGGVNELLGLQARTGINATQQASSVEAFRTYSGYSLSTGDITRVMENLASAPVANRMMLMAGGGLIGPGGTQRSMQQVMQNIVRSAGLTDERLVKSAFAPGSMTRARLTAMGVSTDMQDMVLQYAQQNITYKQKGGKGMYDASNKEARKLMGVEDSFATQTEETERQRERRDERFYDRQADNYADLEKATQRVTKALGSFEDKLSGLFGWRTSTKGKIGTMIGGTIGTIAGTLTGIPGAGFLGAAAGSAIGSIIGDGTPSTNSTPQVASPVQRGDGNDGNIAVPKVGGGTTSLTNVKNWQTFKGMHPKMQERVLNLLRAANGKLGLTEGVRSYDVQKQVFLQRYHKVTQERADEVISKGQKSTLRFWQGSYWEKKDPSLADAAAPGQSFHGAGLAADIYVPNDSAVRWINANVGKYGLLNFARSGEPWHVQPSELNTSWASYMKAGAPWGVGSGENLKDMEAYSDTPESIGEARGGGVIDSTAGSSLVQAANGSLSLVPNSQLANATAESLSNADPISQRVQEDITNTAAGGGATRNIISEQKLEELLKGNGFTGNDLTKMIGLAKTLSNFNSKKKNISGIDKYGLFQLDAEGPMYEFYRSLGLKSKDDLLDPLTNIQMAKATIKKSNMEDFTTSVLTGATTPKGDPSTGGLVGTSSGRSSSGDQIFNITVPITINSSGTPIVDISNAAKQVGTIIKREIQTHSLRTN